MAKEQKTGKQLQAIILDQLRAVEGCGSVVGIGVFGVTARSHNWEAMRLKVGPAEFGLCHRAVRRIVPRLQARYDLID